MRRESRLGLVADLIDSALGLALMAMAFGPRATLAVLAAFSGCRGDAGERGRYDR